MADLDPREMISVILATYNRPCALDAVLRSLSRQSDGHFEIIVADDGSGPETQACIARWERRLPVPLRHVWHADCGFRLAEIRNRAILAAEGAYCVFLDGDCLARPDFIARHRRLAERGWFVTGNRTLLSRELTDRVLARRLEAEMWSLPAWIGRRARRHINRLLPMLRLPLGPLRRRRAREWRGARACNLAVWRADLDRVDGFDAAYQGWGREDSDLFVRLLRAGVRRKDGTFATGVLHLWHPESTREQLPENESRLDLVLRSGAVRAQRGLSSLAASDRYEPGPIAVIAQVERAPQPGA